MKKHLLCLLLLVTLGAPIWAKNPIVNLQTTQGDIIIELYVDKAPISCKNFLAYVQEGFYDGTIFHRVIKNFMIQGGGFNSGLKEKDTLAPIMNEAANGLRNDIGTIAMARTGEVNSATAQFFINTNNNAFLNHRGTNPPDYGYAVFGKVIQGLDIVKKIEAKKTTKMGYYSDVPVEEIIIKKATLLRKEEKK